MTSLVDLQRWYASNCDGDWEHEFGVSVQTLDNPGWSVTIDLDGTNLAGLPFARIDRGNAESDWIKCWVEGGKFHGVGDPFKLETILVAFVDWAKANREDWLKAPGPPSGEEQRRAEDEQLWHSLGDEVGPELCAHAGCPRRRIGLSVKCRQHHFEMITRRACPWSNS